MPLRTYQSWGWTLECDACSHESYNDDDWESEPEIDDVLEYIEWARCPRCDSVLCEVCEKEICVVCEDRCSLCQEEGHPIPYGWYVVEDPKGLYAEDRYICTHCIDSDAVEEAMVDGAVFKDRDGILHSGKSGEDGHIVPTVTNDGFQPGTPSPNDELRKQFANL